MFISFEGMDGSGKTTQIQLLMQYFNQLGKEPLLIREPGGTEISEIIRQVLLGHYEHQMNPVSEVLLFFASRAQLMSQKIQPALASGQPVIADRFADSSFAYQGYGRGISMELLTVLVKETIGNQSPDLTILLDVDYTTSQLRQAGRGKKDRMETMSKEMWEKIREGYFQLVEKSPNRWIVINSQQSESDIHQQIIHQLQTRVSTAF